MRHKKKRLKKEDLDTDDSVLFNEEYLRMTPEELDEAIAAEKKRLAVLPDVIRANYKEWPGLKNKKSD